MFRKESQVTSRLMVAGEPGRAGVNVQDPVGVESEGL